MNFFSDRAGRVVMIPDQSMPFSIRLQGWSGMPAIKAIFTACEVSNQGNFQFLHTLRNFIYVYIFGDRIGEIILSGVFFSGMCDTPDNRTGMELVLGYYESWRLSTWGAPVSIAFGVNKVYQGFLTGSKVGMADPQSGVGQFALRFHHFPDGSSLAAPGQQNGLNDFNEDEEEEEEDFEDGDIDNDGILDISDTFIDVGGGV